MRHYMKKKNPHEPILIVACIFPKTAKVLYGVKVKFLGFPCFFQSIVHCCSRDLIYAATTHHQHQHQHTHARICSHQPVHTTTTPLPQLDNKFALPSFVTSLAWSAVRAVTTCCSAVLRPLRFGFISSWPRLSW